MIMIRQVYDLVFLNLFFFLTVHYSISYMCSLEDLFVHLRLRELLVHMKMSFSSMLSHQDIHITTLDTCSCVHA